MSSQHDRILIVDDDSDLAVAVCESLHNAGFAADFISDPTSIERSLEKALYDAAIIDIRMPQVNGLQVLDHIRATDPAIAVIMLTAHGTADDVIRAFRMGAVDFLQKPASGEEIVQAVRRGLVRTSLARQARPSHMFGLTDPFSTLIGDDDVLRRQIDEARLAANKDVSVLILGETGCGKDLLAEAIHRASPRANGPFLTAVLSARPESLVQGELFGHVKNAFTGAAHASHGLLKSAHNGTVFLDEIGDISMATQVSLLRVLEKKVVLPLGASQEVEIDVRVISATNRDLDADICMGSFRRDLFYRISEFTIRLPPLRERKRDIPKLTWHFAQDAAGDSGNVPIFGADALAKLASYSWPGNVRELRAEVFRVVMRCHGDTITATDCLTNLKPHPSVDDLDLNLPLQQAQDAFTTRYLRYWLEYTKGKVNDVAEHAKLHPQSVRRLMRQYKLREGADE